MTPQQKSLLEGAQQRVKYQREVLNKALAHLYSVEKEIAEEKARLGIDERAE